MKILFISDIHDFNGVGHIINDVKNEEVDIVISLGDIRTEDLIELGNYYTCAKYGVLGNHDSVYELNYTGFENIHEKYIEIYGISITGFGGCPKYKINGYNQYLESDVYNFTENIGKVDLFIAHANPALFETEDYSNPHRGFLAFTEYIKNNKPGNFIHGHIHENNDYTIDDVPVSSVYGYRVIKI